jgi:hypothetical protein
MHEDATANVGSILEHWQTTYASSSPRSWTQAAFSSLDSILTAHLRILEGATEGKNYHWEKCMKLVPAY